MAQILKQSTAIEVKLGPFLDSTDGFTAETGLTITQAEVLLAKNAGDWAQKNESTSLVHESNGWYRCLLDTTDTGTLGMLMLQIAESGAVPVWETFWVVTANIYDTLFSTDLFNVNAQTWNDLARALFAALKMAPQVEYFDMPETLRAKYQYFTQANTTKLHKAGYTRPFLDLKAGVADYVKILETTQYL